VRGSVVTEGYELALTCCHMCSRPLDALTHTHTYIYVARLSLGPDSEVQVRPIDGQEILPSRIRLQNRQRWRKGISKMIFIRRSEIWRATYYSDILSCSWCQWAASLCRPAIAHLFCIHRTPVSALIIGGCCLRCSSFSSSTDRRWLLLRHPLLSGNVLVSSYNLVNQTDPFK